MIKTIDIIRAALNENIGLSEVINNFPTYTEEKKDLICARLRREVGKGQISDVNVAMTFLNSHGPTALSMDEPGGIRIVYCKSKGIDYQWTCVAHVKGDHRIFRDHVSKRYAIADASGNVPQFTEDGVIWLLQGADANICISNDKVMINYRVQRERRPSEPAYACSALRVVPYLIELDYKFTINEALDTLVKTVVAVIPRTAWKR